MTYVVPSPLGAIEVVYRPGEVEARMEGLDHSVVWRAERDGAPIQDYVRTHSQEDAEWFARALARSVEEGGAS